MRILVFSDSHRTGLFLMRLAIEQQPQARTVFFLGDGEEELEALRKTESTLRCFAVCGNGDFGSSLPEQGVAVLEGRRIFYTHGHRQRVKFGTYELMQAGREAKADILLYGHTHRAVTGFEEGMHVMNPGSIRDGSYGVIDLTQAGIVCFTNEVRL